MAAISAEDRGRLMAHRDRIKARHVELWGVRRREQISAIVAISAACLGAMYDLLDMLIDGRLHTRDEMTEKRDATQD